MGGSFSATNHVLLIPGGLAMGGAFSATNHVLLIPEGGWPWGVVFSYKLRTSDSGGGLAMGGSFSATNCVLLIPAEKARQTGLGFRGIAPECVYRFSRWRRGRLAGPGNAGPGPAGQAVLRSPEGPFWCSRGRFFRQSQKERGRERPAGFSGSRGGLAMGGSFSATNHVLLIPRGVGHGGVVFSYKPRTSDSGDENRCPTLISLGGQVQKCVQIFPASILGGCAPPGC